MAPWCSRAVRNWQLVHGRFRDGRAEQGRGMRRILDAARDWTRVKQGFAARQGGKSGLCPAAG